MIYKEKQQNLPQKKKSPKKEQTDQRSYWQMMIDGIVRPPRAKYNNSQLGKKIITYIDKIFERKEYFVDHDGKKLQVSFYQAVPEKPYQIPYVILYMHGNSSCRLQALGLIKHIPQGISLASFDFIGCGKNEQANTVTLGYRQAEQAKTVTQYIRNLGFKVILWGRSMGAATALLYGKAQFIVADSSFKSFKSLCKQVAKQHSPPVIPNFMISCFFPCVFSKLKKDVDKKAQYDVEDLDVKEAVKNLDTQTVVIFMSGDQDVLINKRNSEKLYAACPCKEKHLKIFAGDHNSKRPQETQIQIMGIIEKHVQKHQKIIQKNSFISSDDINIKVSTDGALKRLKQ